MKKRLCGMLALTIVLMLGASGSCERLYVDNRETDKIYPERLNLRAEPDKKGAILGLYYTGAEVESVGVPLEDGYVQVEIGGQTGYMAEDYLITEQEAQARYGADFGISREAQVDLSGLWKNTLTLHETADEEGKALLTLNNGATVTMIGVLDAWAYVQAKDADGNKVQGYVPLDALTDVGELKVSIITGDKADSRTILYSAPNNRAQELMSLKNGTACFNLFGRKEGNWRRVRVGGVSGWIKQTRNLTALGDQARNTIPYYPLVMQTKTDALLYKTADKHAQHYMTLGEGMQVEVLAEYGDDAYVRTLEGGAGSFQTGDYGYISLKQLTLAQAGEHMGVALVDHQDVPVPVMDSTDKHAKMLGALCPGAQVRIVSYTQTDYVQITMGTLRGYVRKEDIRSIDTRTTNGTTSQSQQIPLRAPMTATVDLREAPQDEAKSAGVSAQAGQRVYVLGTFGEWAFVQAADQVGLCDTEADRTGFVKLTQVNAPASTTHLTAFVNKDKVNLRSKASSTEGGIIGKARTGQRLRVAEYGKNWCVVVTQDEKRGYIMTKYLDFE